LTDKGSNIGSYVGIIFTLVIAALLFLSGAYTSYPAYQMIAWQNLNDLAKYFLVFIAIISLIASVYLHGAKRRILESKRQPESKEK